jgi:hypothetical protein
MRRKGPPRFFLDSPAPYPKAAPELWGILLYSSHRSYSIWWGIFLVARSRERRRLTINGAAQNAAGRRQNSTLGSIDHDSEGIVESIRCRRCGGTGLYPSKYLE